MQLSIRFVLASLLLALNGCAVLETDAPIHSDTPQKFDAEGNPNFGPAKPSHPSAF